MLRVNLTVLGSGSAMPSWNRFHTSQLLEVDGVPYLIDCGEGAQIQLRRNFGKVPRVRQIFISHLHGDHCFGLIGLISSLEMTGNKADLEIFSPPGLEELLRPQLDFFCAEREFEVKFSPFSPYQSATIFEDKRLTVKTLPLKHRVPTCGFLFEEKEKERHLKSEMIEAFSIPISKLKEIKLGADFVDEQGRVVENARLTTDPTPPIRFAYCSDTMICEKNLPLLSGVDCLFHEATFAETECARAKETFHSTAKQAAIFAKKAGAKKLIIGHFSARYKDLQPLLDEARAEFEQTFLAQDGGRFEV